MLLIGEPFINKRGDLVSIFKADDQVQLHLGEPRPTVAVYSDEEVGALGDDNWQEGVVRLGQFGNVEPDAAYLGERYPIEAIKRAIGL